MHQTRCANVTVGCHVYHEEMISATPMNTSRFLWYGFKRRRLQPQNSELSLDAYLDTITSPFEYQVLSIRTQLKDSNPTAIIGAFKSLLEQLSCLWDNVIPVGFSKFMFVMKCLPAYDDYEEFFSHFDNAHEVITKNIDCLLSTTDHATNRQLYIWTLQEQLDRLSAMRDFGKFDDERCRENLAKFYAKVVNGTARIVRCDPYDI